MCVIVRMNGPTPSVSLHIFSLNHPTNPRFTALDHCCFFKRAAKFYAPRISLEAEFRHQTLRLVEAAPSCE